MAKSIDMGESYGEPAVASPKKKYYPSLQIPVKIDPKMVGKTVTLVIQAKVIGVRQTTDEGSKTRNRCDIEVHSVKMPRQRAKSGSAQYVEPWMDEMGK